MQSDTTIHGVPAASLRQNDIQTCQGDLQVTEPQLEGTVQLISVLSDDSTQSAVPTHCIHCSTSGWSGQAPLTVHTRSNTETIPTINIAI